MKKIKFGVLSTAKIALEHVIPAMKQCSHCEVTAIASRNANHAREAAKKLDLHRHYGSYEELLADQDIDAVYIPLPNHLHVHWSVKAIEAGKHVLCEKPLAMTEEEAKSLLIASQKYPRQKVMEAFVYKFHPRWQRTKELITDGTIGQLKVIHSYISYYNDDAGNIRNKKETGGGSLMDIGCYNVSSARFLFDSEPLSAIGSLEMEPDFRVDRLTSGILKFENGNCMFSCNMRSPRYQYMKLFGTEGHIHMDFPFNPQAGKSSVLTVTTEKKAGVQKTEELQFEPCNQFTLQADRFSESIISDTPVPYPLEDAVANMRVIDLLRN